MNSFHSSTNCKTQVCKVCNYITFLMWLIYCLRLLTWKKLLQLAECNWSLYCVYWPCFFYLISPCVVWGLWSQNWVTTFVIIPTNLKTVISYDGSTLNWQQQNRNNWNRCSHIWQTEKFSRRFRVSEFTVCFFGYDVQQVSYCFQNIFVFKFVLVVHTWWVL